MHVAFGKIDCHKIRVQAAHIRVFVHDAEVDAQISHDPLGLFVHIGQDFLGFVLHLLGFRLHLVRFCLQLLQLLVCVLGVSRNQRRADDEQCRGEDDSQQAQKGVDETKTDFRQD